MKIVKIKKKILSKGIVKFSESDDFKELREYIPSEDIRNIHWLSSAKHRKLLAIQREPLQNQKIAIILLLDKNMLFKDKLDIAKEIFKILGYSAIYLKQKLEIIIVTDKIKTFTPKHFKEIEKIINYLEKLNLKKCSLTKFEFKKKGFLAIYIGDFFYRIKLNKQNKNVLLIVRKKIEENPKSLLFNTLISTDKKEKTFLNIDNLKHYLKTLKKNDKLYKSEKIKKFYENKNILNLLKETFE